MSEVQKIDANSTGLRYAEESSLAVLPAAASQKWYPAEPNSYSDFGGQLKLVARRPINASRQNQKGVVTDLDASGGYNTDMTFSNLQQLERSFFFADMREMFDSQALDGTFTTVSSAVASDDTFNMADATDVVAAKVLAQSLLFSSGFAIAANNGVFVVASISKAAATSTLTITSTNNALDTETATIGSKVYTFQDTLTNVDGHIKIGADKAATLANLAHAINASGGTSGTDYAAANTVHPTVTATVASPMVINAKLSGTAGNLIATTETLTNGSWTSTFMAGGAGSIDTGTGPLTDETPPTTARVQVVGYQFTVSTLDVSVASTWPRLVRATGAVDFTTLGLVPGQFIYIGGDLTAQNFVASNNNGWARVRSVGTTYIEIDKATSAMTAETGASLTVRIWYGKVIKNETAASGLIQRHSFTFERDLGQKETTDTDHQGEYISGALANELTLNVKQADKINTDLTFIAVENSQRGQDVGLLSAAVGATAVSLVSEDAFNTSTHVARMRMTILEDGNESPDVLWGFCTDFTITIKNNCKPSKTVSRIGAFEVTAGQFDVGGKVTAYFSDVAAVEAVRANSDASFDCIFARDNYGVAYDLPLIALGDARLTVAQDSEIHLPLDMTAAEDHTFHHTLSKSYFPYLPDVAMPT